MSKFKIVSTNMKIVIEVFVFHLSMYQTVANGDGNGGQQWWPKVNLWLRLLQAVFQRLQLVMKSFKVSKMTVNA